MSEKESLIQAILKQRAEIEQAKSRLETLNQMKTEAEERAKNLEVIMGNGSTEGMKTISNERSYALKKEIEDEETIKTCSSEKWGSVLQGKLELERKVQAEEEFISRNLRKRLRTLHKETTVLRSELLAKKKLVSDFCFGNCEAETKEKVQKYQTQLSNIAQEIAESYENQRSVEEKRDRLNTVLENITDRRKGQAQKAGQISFDSKRRKSNFAVPKKHFVPAMRIQK